MKKFTAFEFLIVLIVVLVFITSSFIAKGNDTTSTFELSGKILKIKVTVSNSYSVALLSEGSIIDYKVIKGNNEFKFDLNMNGKYSLRITKRGYQSKLITVDSQFATKQNGEYKLHFDTELIENDNAFNIKPSESKVALVPFDPKKRWFNYNTLHSNKEKAMFYKGSREYKN